MTYETVADHVVATFTDPTGLTAQQQAQSVAGQPSPVNGTLARSARPRAPPSAATRRRSTSSRVPEPSIEASALVVFDVADSLGTLQLVKFEDVNGDGIRQAGEPGVPGWVFRLTNPQGNTSVAVDRSDGTVTIPSVPAGAWQVAEVVDPMWAAITPATGTVTVPAGGTGTFTAGNVRPAPISGVVYIDTNGNGIRDAGEVGRAGRAPRPGRHAPRRHHRRGAGHALRQPTAATSSPTSSPAPTPWGCRSRAASPPPRRARSAASRSPRARGARTTTSA